MYGARPGVFTGVQAQGRSGFDSRTAGFHAILGLIYSTGELMTRIVAVLKNCDLYALYCDQRHVEVQVVDYETLAESGDPDAILEAITEGMVEVA